MKKIFVTGGHYTPARAVINELIEKYKIFYIGRKYALEGDTAISLEYQEMKNDKCVTFLEITTGRLQRKFTKNTLPSLLKIPIGFLQSFLWILKYQPDAILSFGGYVSIPVSSVAFIFGIPIVNHEQIPAFDYPSKYLNAIATKVLVSFPHLVKKNEIYTGNPVRSEIFHKSIPHPKTIYITGGNQGSHIINSAIFPILDKLLEKYDVIWQTGDSQEFKDFDKVPQKKNLTAKKFFSSSEIGSVYARSDLVISRAGANTVTELAALGIPSILIPIPWVHDAEQQKNAESLSQFSGSIIINQKDLTPDFLLERITEVFESLTDFKNNSEKAKVLYIKDSAKKIASELESVLHE